MPLNDNIDCTVPNWGTGKPPAMADRLRSVLFLKRRMLTLMHTLERSRQINHGIKIVA
jgi:hypothetical protein